MKIMNRFAFRVSGVVVAIMAAAMLLGVALAGPQPVANGDFEAGDLSGWTAFNNNAGGQGGWFAYSGTKAPLTPPSIGKVPAPPQGTYAAITDQTGPGLRVLYQDIALPADAETLSFLVYYENRGIVFYTPDNLDPELGPPGPNPNRNQQYRIDLMDPDAPMDSVAAGDVLRNLFWTEVGDPASLAATLVSEDISQFAGSTVRLRLAEVDNQFMLHAGIDDVRVGTGASGGILVEIDIKPGGSDNNVNLKSNGKIRVAVISAPGFDATTVIDDLSLSFGRTGDEQSLVDCDKPHKDVNGDGVDDLLCHFDTAATGFVEGDTEGVLKGRTVDGIPIEGSDSVRIVP